MGRKVSLLIPFLIEALEGEKYPNLKFENALDRTFSLFLPQKSAHLDVTSQLVLQGWFNVKRRPYKMGRSYTEAKQCIEAALRKSDFLELVSKGKKQKLVYRILDQSQILEKKRLQKEKKKALKLELDNEPAPSPGSSGYGSGSDHPEEIYEWDENYNWLQGLSHDHKYVRKTEHVTEAKQQHSHVVESQNRAEVLYDLKASKAFCNLIPEYVGMETGKASIGNGTQPYINTGMGQAAIGYGTQSHDNSFNLIAESKGFPDIKLEDPLEIVDMVTKLSAIGNDSVYNVKMMESPEFKDMKLDPLEIVDMVTNSTPNGNEHVYTLEVMESPGNESMQQFQHGGVKEFAPCVEKEKIDKARHANYWDSLAKCRRTFQNPFGDVDLSKPPDNLFSDEDEDDPSKMEINLDLPHGDVSPLSDADIEDIFDFVMESEKHSEVEKVSTPTTTTKLEISSYMTTLIKVYECLHLQRLPGMIMLTCEPKMKEFPMIDSIVVDPSQPKFIFDEATMQLVSKCRIENMQLLSNDHLLVFLKYRELINEKSSPNAECLNIYAI